MKVPKVNELGVMDVFFDNIFSDMARHDRIAGSARTIEQVGRWLHDIVVRTENGQRQLTERCGALRARREELLNL